MYVTIVPVAVVRFVLANTTAWRWRPGCMRRSWTGQAGSSGSIGCGAWDVDGKICCFWHFAECARAEQRVVEARLLHKAHVSIIVLLCSLRVGLVGMCSSHCSADMFFFVLKKDWRSNPETMDSTSHLEQHALDLLRLRLLLLQNRL